MPSSNWILLGEDNREDMLLTRRALVAVELPYDVMKACDGREVLDCLYRRGRFADRAPGNPAVVLLDLKMPFLDGLETLRVIKGDPELKCIPVVIHTASYSPADIRAAYELGANGYVVKSTDYTQFRKEFKLLGLYWISVNCAAGEQ